MPLLRGQAGVGVPAGPVPPPHGGDAAVAQSQPGEGIGEGGLSVFLWVHAYREFIRSSVPFPAHREKRCTPACRSIRTHTHTHTHIPWQWECKPPCIRDIGVRDSRRTTVWLSRVATIPGSVWCLHEASPRPRCEGTGRSQGAARRLVPGSQEPIRDTIVCKRKSPAVPVPTRAAVRAQGCPRALGLHIPPSFSNSLTSNPNRKHPQPFGQP